MITLSEFTRRLLDFSACSFVGMRAVHVPEMRVRNNPYHGRTLKLSRVNGVINWKYSRAVNRQRKREDKPQDFQAVERTWGNRVTFCPLVLHLDESGQTQFYLELKRERVERWYFNSETLAPIPEVELLPYLPKRAKSRQKLDREVVLRDYRLDHIAELTIDGETWRIGPAWWQLTALRQAYVPKKEAS